MLNTVYGELHPILTGAELTEKTVNQPMGYNCNAIQVAIRKQYQRGHQILRKSNAELSVTKASTPNARPFRTIRSKRNCEVYEIVQGCEFAAAVVGTQVSGRRGGVQGFRGYLPLDRYLKGTHAKCWNVDGTHAPGTVERLTDYLRYVLTYDVAHMLMNTWYLVI